MMPDKSFLGVRRPIQGRLQTGLFVALLCTAGFQTAGAATLTLVPSESNVSVGDTVSVELNISGLGDDTAPSLGAYDITVDTPGFFTFNNAAFGDSVLESDQLGSSAFTETILGSDTIQLIEVSFESVAALNSTQPDAFTLATLNFTATGPGSGSFSLADVTLSDASGLALSSSVSNASISAFSSVPEPSTLVPLGVLALVGLMRKRLGSLTRS